MPTYIVHRTAIVPELAGLWDGPAWANVPSLDVAHFHPRSSSHRPRTRVKILHDPRHLHALFRVEDRYVRSVHTAYESDTYQDSCVELFVQPRETPGYFAFEINCGGALSLRHIEDPTRTADRFARWSAIDHGVAASIRIAHSMPDVVDPEIAHEVEWWVEMACPLSVLETCCGPLAPASGQRWRANCYKCADRSSHPHWASWAPIGEALNFHQPAYFGVFEFADRYASRKDRDSGTSPMLGPCRS